jgi:phasin family protein
MSQPTAGAEVQKANVEAVFDLAVKMVDAGDKLTQLTFEVTRSMLTQFRKNTLATLRSKETGEVVASQARQAESIPDAAVSYTRQLFDVANYFQAEMTRYAQAQVDAYKENMRTYIDQVAKNAPVGSEATVSAWKSAMETTRSFYETMQKNYPSIPAAAARDLPAVSTAAKGTRGAAGQASATAKP